MKERERRGTPDQEGDEGAPPNQHALPSYGFQEREGGTPKQEGEGGHPLRSVRPSHTAYLRGKWGDTRPKGGKGGTPQEGLRTLRAWHDKGDGGSIPTPVEAPHHKTKR